MTSLVVALLIVVLAASVPGSRAAFSALVNNSTNTTSTLPYFTCAAAILADGPVLYYKLNETGTTTVATDSSANGTRTGTYRGTVTKGVGPACARDGGNAVIFNGSSGYASSGTSLVIPTTYTSEVWFKTTTTSGGLLTGFGAVGIGGSLEVDRVLYMTNAGKIVLGINILKNTISSSLSYNNGAWHHVMATVGPAGMRLHVDGGQVATSTVTATAPFTGFFRVGYDSLLSWPNAPTSNFFGGSLDEAAAYSKTLTATDAHEHYRAGT